MQMNTNIADDVNVKSLKQLITPIELLEEIPASAKAIQTVIKGRKEAKQIVKGIDDRLLLIVGPCSIHNNQAALEYGTLLKEACEKFKNELCIIMRVYFEKPRTTVGWKGLINDPHLDNSFEINHGLKVARNILTEINELGIPAATEFLDTIIPQYIADLISWGAIGARTTESQIHRELASGLSVPIGFKNGTDGNIDIAIDAINSANFAHHFLGITKSGRPAIVSTCGNDACHIILRGAKNSTNYGQATITKVTKELAKKNLHPTVMVDCSHGNSQKQYQKQITVINNIAKQIGAGSQDIMGVMLESHLTSGNQSLIPGQKWRHDQSITDACLSWEETKPLLTKLANAVIKRRKKLEQQKTLEKTHE